MKSFAQLGFSKYVCVIKGRGDEFTFLFLTYFSLVLHVKESNKFMFSSTNGDLAWTGATFDETEEENLFIHLILIVFKWELSIKNNVEIFSQWTISMLKGAWIGNFSTRSHWHGHLQGQLQNMGFRTYEEHLNISGFRKIFVVWINILRILFLIIEILPVEQNLNYLEFMCNLV